MSEGIWQEAKVAAKHPTVHKTAPRKEGASSPKCPQCPREQPWALARGQSQSRMAGAGGREVGASVWIRPPFGGNGILRGVAVCLSHPHPTRHPLPVPGCVEMKATLCVFFLTVLSAGSFLKPAAAFFFHEKKGAPCPWGVSFCSSKRDKSNN